jgi:putative peptide zinc metalloprotease protein
VVLSDPSVSRVHARISADAVLEDAGSSHGTWLDGERVTQPAPLRDGARIRLGDAELRVERRREMAEAGRTIVVRAGASVMVPSVGAPAVSGGSATQFGLKPRVRSGYALKRLDASEGPRRWVLKDEHTGGFLRLSDNDAWVFEQLDGTHSLIELIAMCEQRYGPPGPARLARLLSDLGERGFLAGVAGGRPVAEAPPGFWRRVFKPREKVFTGLGPFVERIYRLGGWIFFTRWVQYVVAALIVVGVGTFVALIVGRYGTPFVVASKFGVGGLVFLGGRFAVVAVHELAHGLTMASFGRRVDRAGLKTVAIFPYAFVDTSEAWFEPRRRRIAVSAAGPVSDFSLGAVFALCALFLPDGTVRDIFFNLAFAAYVGGFFNLNPFIERDGYHMLVDWLDEPGLRRRAKEQLERRLRGQAA